MPHTGVSENTFQLVLAGQLLVVQSKQKHVADSELMHSRRMNMHDNYNELQHMGEHADSSAEMQSMTCCVVCNVGNNVLLRWQCPRLITNALE